MTQDDKATDMAALGQLFDKLTSDWLEQAETACVRTALLEAKVSSILQVGVVPPAEQRRVVANIALVLTMFAARRIANIGGNEDSFKNLCRDVIDGKYRSMEEFMEQTFAGSLTHHSP